MEHTDLILYIELRDGQPINHPIFHDNFVQAFPDVDPDNLPSDRFAKFIRVSPPNLGVYEVYVGVSYQWVNGIVKDVHEVRQMTDEEKATKQKAVKDAWAAREQSQNWAAWIFDEETCSFVPPIPRPEPDQIKINQRIRTFWCGDENNWKDTQPYPNDGKLYKFDFLAWNWVELNNEQPT